MLSKNTIKEINSLHLKKFRNEKNLFIAEGEKVVLELIKSSFKVRAVYFTDEFSGIIKAQAGEETEMMHVNEDELRKISALSTPNKVLAVAEIPDEFKIDYSKGLKLVLDDISDPGNLGTLIRIADWFGISEVICSPDTVDCYNPKVVQSAMGSLFHLQICYSDLVSVFRQNLSQNMLDVYATVLNGNSIYEEELTPDGFILVGNESKGVRDEHLTFVKKKITIPSIKGHSADSLNVAVATGIVCAEFSRRIR